MGIMYSRGSAYFFDPTLVEKHSNYFSHTVSGSHMTYLVLADLGCELTVANDEPHYSSLYLDHRRFHFLPYGVVLLLVYYRHLLFSEGVIIETTN